MGQPSTVSSAGGEPPRGSAPWSCQSQSPGRSKACDARRRPRGRFQSIGEEGEDVGDDVQLRVDLDTLCINTTAAPDPPLRGPSLVVLKAPDVVDNGGPSLDGGGGDARLHRIDGNRGRDPALEAPRSPGSRGKAPPPPEPRLRRAGSSCRRYPKCRRPAPRG